MTRALAVLLGGALLLPGAVPAQEPDTARAASDTLPAIVLDSLRVTVLRSPMELMRAPFAVSALQVDDARRGEPGLSLDEALLGVPGVQVDDRFNDAVGERISVRGFGARAAFGVRGVKVLLDGIPATLPDGQTTLNHIDPALLGRVEVIRGPASTLYGNASGGVLRLRTVLPPDAGLREEVRATVGGNGLRRVESRTGGRIGDAGYLVSLSALDYDGFRERSASEHLRGNVVVRIPRGGGELRVWANGVDYSALNPGSLDDSLLATDPTQAFGFNVAQRTGEEGRQAQLGVAWETPAGPGRLETTAWGIRREIDNPIPPAIIDLERWGGGLRALYRRTSGGTGWSPGWAVGAEGELQRDDRLNFENEGGERGATTLDQEETVSAGAVFGQLHLRPLPRLDVLAGLRFDAFEFEADDHLVRPGDGGNPDDSGSRTLSAWSPALGLSVEAARGIHLYGNVATSFETPTTTELANRPDGSGGFNPALEPQRTLSVEAGIKGRLPGRLAYQATAFRAEVDDQLIPFEVAGAPGRQFFRNAGSSIHRGVELSLRASLPGGLTAEAAYSHLDARFDAFRTADDRFDGNRVPGVAPNRLDAALSWRGRRGAWLRGQLRHLSDVPADDANTAEAEAYTLVSVRGGAESVRVAGLRLTPFAGIDNLFDEAYVSSLVPNAFGERYFEPGAGRTGYAGVSLFFGEG